MATQKFPVAIDEGHYPDDDIKAVLVEGKWRFERKDGTAY